MLAMGVVLAMAGFGIDMASWYQKHHQSQVAADAAALAAANCMRNAGTGQTCTSTTDTADAIRVATTFAASNGVAIPASDVSVASGAVTVTTPQSAPSFLASVAGVHPTVSATATATWQVAGSNCSTPGSTCGFIFANDPSCSGSGATVINNGTSAIIGGIESNGNMSFTQSGNHDWNVTVSYAASGAGHNTCTFNPSAGNHDPYSGTPTTYPLPPNISTDWPINFGYDYPACSSTGTYQCTGPGLTPSYCTYSSTSANWSPASGTGVYCAVGSGAASTPSTWNGTINAGAVSGATYIGGSVTLNTSNGNFSPESGTVSPATSPNPAPNLLAYAITGSVTLSGSGNGTGSGDIFAPTSTANVSFSGGETYTGFIEANDVTYSSSGTDSGNGPQDTGGIIPTPPADALTQ